MRKLKIPKDTCNATIDGKHILRKEVITVDKVVTPWGSIVYELPIYATKCIACGKWDKLIKELK